MIQVQTDVPEPEPLPLAPEVLRIVLRIKRALNEVFMLTRWEWRNVCCNACDQKHTILFWLRVAQLYQSCRPAAVRGEPLLSARQREAALTVITACLEKGPERAMEDRSTKPDCLAAAEIAFRTFRAGPTEAEAEELAQASVILDSHLDDLEIGS